MNACLAPLCSMHGLAVTTVEGIGSVKNGLHPVQVNICNTVKHVFNRKYYLYRWYRYKTPYVHFSKFYRRDKKLSGLFAFCYILIRFRLKAYFKFI